ncbi:hypothetical protein IFO69_15540 [Echinicola sp. CAU 1574]|uniref:Uncharacterized protein n=1 Tax=Echinicola arenosa TaxID=2774144 RepID=A0ABR9AMY2_9BACT|nr:hypothetical protein [Echinicola arenosa]MBD8490168.1 hypothetical protein [Echinicola arenosa]
MVSSESGKREGRSWKLGQMLGAGFQMIGYAARPGVGMATFVQNGTAWPLQITF